MYICIYSYSTLACWLHALNKPIANFPLAHLMCFFGCLQSQEKVLAFLLPIIKRPRAGNG